MSGKTEKIKARVFVMNGQQTRYHGKNKYKGHDIYRILYKNIKVGQLRRFANKKSRIFYDNGKRGRINVAMKIPDLGWRTGPGSDIGDKVILWTDTAYNSSEGLINNSGYDEDTLIPKCHVYFFIQRESDQPTGGKGDEKTILCFYNCVKNIFTDAQKKEFNTGKKFMKRFKLKESDPVELSLIPTIEKSLNIKIDVIGDHFYYSDKNYTKRILLNLTEGHYTVIEHVAKLKNKMYSHHERRPIMITNIDKRYVTYDGEDFDIVDYHEYKSATVNFRLSYMYIWIQLTEAEKKDHERKLIKEYETFVKEADELKAMTDGKINLYKTGRYKDTAVYYVSEYLKHMNYEFEEMGYLENEWHIKCNRGGVIYHDYTDTTYEKLYSYDICSAYPHIMTTQKTIPYKAGEFLILTNEEQSTRKSYYKGIYRATVEAGHKLFSYNRYNYYCNEELQEANKLKLKITLIEDGEPNFLHYDNTKCVALKTLFKKPIQTLFDLKQKGYAGAKKILVNLFGCLTEKNKQELDITISEEDYAKGELMFKYADNWEITGAKSVADDKVKITFKQIDKLYKGPLPRAQVFITAFCRQAIYKKVGDNMEHVKMILTDGIYTDKDIFPKDKLPKDKELGDWVREGYYKDVKIISGKSHKVHEFVKF